MKMQRPILILTATLLAAATAMPAQTAELNPAKLAPMGTVDERFQSYNVEMVEVIGGSFWKPYGAEVDAMLKQRSAPGAPAPAGMDPNMYQKRDPIDLSNPRLRKLAAALGPAYIRVSGTWANTTYFQDSDAPAPAAPPKGYNGVLTRSEWKGVVDFSKAVDARIVSSVATSAGARDASGVWTPAQAASLYAYTKSIGGSIAATEFMNEPTFAAMGGTPKGYDAAAYARDTAVFKPFLKKVSPGTLLLGPGSVGEGGAMGAAVSKMLSIHTDDMLKATGDVFDVFSYHYYGGASIRCGALGAAGQTSEAVALSPAWLAQTNEVEAFYAHLRDTYAPGKPMWLTETGETACGGNPWASTFTDSFRYLNQLGTLARHGVKVVMHNTLAASDYALIDDRTLTPRPNYWSAYLWRKTMGTTVLDASASQTDGLYVYAHCLRSQPGGVALLVMNTDAISGKELQLKDASQRYTLTAQHLGDRTVMLNGKMLQLDSEGNLPGVSGVAQKKGSVTFAPESITFLAVPDAGNASCK